MLREEEKEYLMKIRKLKKSLEGINENEKVHGKILGESGESKTFHTERATTSD